MLLLFLHPGRRQACSFCTYQGFHRSAHASARFWANCCTMDTRPAFWEAMFLMSLRSRLPLAQAHFELISMPRVL